MTKSLVHQAHHRPTKGRWIEMNKTVFETSDKPKDEIGVIYTSNA